MANLESNYSEDRTSVFLACKIQILSLKRQSWSVISESYRYRGFAWECVECDRKSVFVAIAKLNRLQRESAKGERESGWVKLGY